MHILFYILLYLHVTVYFQIPSCWWGEIEII